MYLITIALEVNLFCSIFVSKQYNCLGVAILPLKAKALLGVFCL